MAPPRAKTSPMWFHFKEGVNEAHCNHCKTWLSTKSGSLGNLRRHLNIKHPDINIEKIPSIIKKETYVPSKEVEEESDKDFESSNEDELDNSMVDNEIIIVEDKKIKEKTPPPTVATKYVVKKDPLSFLFKNRPKPYSNEDSRKDTDNVNTNNCNCENNEFVLFGKMVGVQLQNFPVDIALKVQIDIQNLIAQKRLEILDTFRKESAGIQVKILESLK